MEALQIPDIASTPINTDINKLSQMPKIDLSKPVDDSVIMSNIRNQFNLENPYKKSESLFIPTAETPVSVTQRYNDKKLGYSAFNPDIEHDYADHQSWYESLGINALGFATRGLATFLGGFSDIPDTIEAIGTNSLDAFTNTTYKNELSDWAESFSEKFPVYETRYTAEHPWMSFINPLEWKSFTNRWGTVVNNLGFTAGAIANAVVTDAAIAYATGGVGEVLLLPKQASTIGKSIWNLGKSFEYGKTASNLSKILSTPKNILSELRAIGAANKGMTAFRTGLNLYNSAVGEASIEGYHTFKEQKKNLIDSYAAVHGSDPTGTALAEIEENARGTGNATFLANTGLLLATNYLTFGKILKPTSLALREAEISAVRGAVRTAGLDAVEQIPKSTKLLDRFTTGLKNTVSRGGIARTMLTEGFEEGSQYTISESSKDYWTSKYRGSDEADDLFKSLSKGVQKTLFTREGMENIVMGALSGPLISGFTSVYNRGRARISGEKYIPSKNKAIENAIQTMNSTAGLTGSISTLHGELSTQMDLQKRYEKAVAEGNVELSNTLKNDAFFNWVHSANKSGLFDLRIEALNDAKNLKDEDFANFWGIDYSQSNSKTASSYLDLLSKKATDYKQISDSVENAFGKNPYNYKNQSDKYISFENYKQALAHTLVEVKDSDTRFEQLKAETNAVLPSLDINVAMNLTTREGLISTITKLNSKIDSLKEMEASTETLPELKSKIKSERDFIQEQVNTFNDYINGKKENSDDFSIAFRKTISYLNDPTSINKQNYPKQLDDLFEKFHALNYLQDRAVKANKYYEKLRSKNGFEEFHNEVQSVISQAYLKRLDIKDGKLYIKSSKQVLDEKQKEIEDLLKDDDLSIDIEAEKLTEEQMPLADLPPLVDDQLDYEAALDKIEEGKEDTLTEKEKEAYEAHTAHEKRAALKEEIKKKLEEAKKEAPTSIKAAELKEGDKVKHNTETHTVKDITYNEDNKTVDTVTLVSPDGKEILVRNTLENKDEFTFNLPTNAVIDINERRTNIKQAPTTDASSIENLFGNVFEYVENDEEVKQFNAVRANVESPILKMVSSVYTKYILNSQIFKFIFKDKLNVESAKIVVRKYNKDVDTSAAPTKIGSTNLFRKRSEKEAILYLNGKPTGYISNSNNLMIVQNGEFVPLSSVINKLTKEQYVKLTGYDESTFDTFVSSFKSYNALSKNIFDRYDETKEVEISEKETKSLIKIIPSLINAKTVNKAEDATLLKDIQALGENSYIISVRRKFGKNTNGEYTTVKEVNVIGNSGKLTAEQIEADEELSKLMNDKEWMKILLSNNSRYSLLNRLPSGKFAKFSRVVARPINLNVDTIEDLYQALNTKDTEKLATLLPTIFMAEGILPKGNGLSYEFVMDIKGNVSLNINQEKISQGVQNVITIDLTDIAETADSLSEFISFVNIDLENQKRDTFDISKITINSFKQNIKDDEQAVFNDYMDTLSVATTPYFYNKIKMTIAPRESFEDVSEETPSTKSEIEDKKAELLNKKNQELAVIPTTQKQEVSSFVSGFKSAFDKFAEKMGYDKTEKTGRAKINEVFKKYGYGTQDEIDSKKANEIYKNYVKKIHPDKYQDEKLKNIANEFILQLNQAREEGNVDALHNIYKLFVEAKYDIELAELDKQLTMPIVEPAPTTSTYLGEPSISKVEDGELYEFKTEDGLIAGVMTSSTDFRIDGITANEVGKGKGSKMFEALINYLKNKKITILSTVSAGEGAVAMHNKAIQKGLLKELSKSGRNATFQIINNLNKEGENLENPNIVRIFAKDYDINDIEGIAKARLLQKEMQTILPQLLNNNTIKRTNCK